MKTFTEFLNEATKTGKVDPDALTRIGWHMHGSSGKDYQAFIEAMVDEDELDDLNKWKDAAGSWVEYSPFKNKILVMSAKDKPKANSVEIKRKGTYDLVYA